MDYRSEVFLVHFELSRGRSHRIHRLVEYEIVYRFFRVRKFGIGYLCEVERGRIVDRSQLAELTKLAQDQIESGLIGCFQGGCDGLAERKLETIESQRFALVFDDRCGGKRERKVWNGVFQRVNGEYGGCDVFLPQQICKDRFEDLSIYGFLRGLGTARF